jgi:hypothetical protein
VRRLRPVAAAAFVTCLLKPPAAYAAETTPATVTHPEFSVFGDVALWGGFLRLPLAQSNLGPANYSGSQLGLVRPVLATFGMGLFGSAFLGRHFLITPLETTFAFGKSDATGTDPISSQVGDLFVWDTTPAAIDAVLTVDRCTWKAGVAPGIRLLDIGMHDPDNIVVGHFYVRPRIRFEFELVRNVAIGAYVDDDLLRTQSWGGGVLLTFRSDNFADRSSMHLLGGSAR